MKTSLTKSYPRQAWRWLLGPWISAGIMAIAAGGEIRTVEGLAYHPAAEGIADPEGRCRVDLRIPENAKDLPVLVWFHGGGLTGGERGFPPYEGDDVLLVAAGYRLSPQVPCPVFIEDAAAAVSWTMRNISRHGGNPQRVFIGGHSAGGYLAAMVAMDPQWLAKHDLKPGQLAGFIPVSAQVTTHFHVKELRGIGGNPLVPVIDAFAPLHFVSKHLPALCLITGDRALDWPARVEENDLMAATLRHLGHKRVEFHEAKGRDHQSVMEEAAKLMPPFIHKVCEEMDAADAEGP